MQGEWPGAPVIHAGPAIDHGAFHFVGFDYGGARVFPGHGLQVNDLVGHLLHSPAAQVRVSRGNIVKVRQGQEP